MTVKIFLRCHPCQSQVSQNAGWVVRGFFGGGVSSGAGFRGVLLILLLLGLLFCFCSGLCVGFFSGGVALSCNLSTDVRLEQTVTIQKEVLVLCNDRVCVVFWQLLPPYGFP